MEILYFFVVFFVVIVILIFGLSQFMTYLYRLSSDSMNFYKIYKNFLTALKSKKKINKVSKGIFFFFVAAFFLRSNFLYLIFLCNLYLWIDFFINKRRSSLPETDFKFPNDIKEFNVKKFLMFLCLLELTFFYLGLTQILIETKAGFWIFKNSTEVSVHSVLVSLFEEKEYLVAYMVLYFGIFGTFIKIILKYFSISYFVNTLQKFSFFDIFVVSLLIFSSKLSSLMEVDAHVGTYYLIISVALGYLYLLVKAAHSRVINKIKDSAAHL